MSETLQEDNIINNNDPSIIPVMDPPMKNKEANTEDGMPDGNLEWQELEAAVCRCYSKQVFLKISQYSQKNICVGVSFY